ncbi:hypothetical protein BP5796_13008 [Coleophoma crateriformis]|uniref:Uncharacterized protein n=1 Tax=Coleophoma crateriformis TaxID=565419 RepID=A0A3D8Q539_9HELO|nr:hypothetical protein BP5796_13008 [Coleophoma crateriformis]
MSSTTTPFGPDITPICCWISDPFVNIQVWYNSSVDVTVSTVITQIYQYNNTRVTSYTTVSADDTPSATLFNGIDSNVTFSGVPTNIIVPEDPYGEQWTSLVYGTAFTDPYGQIIPSPTAFFAWNTDAPIEYGSQSATMTVSASVTGWACPDEEPFLENDGSQGPYPSGFYLPIPENSTNSMFYSGQGYSGDINVELPQELLNYMEANPSPGAPSYWSSLSLCSPGYMEGQPTAHIPVNALTAGVTKTLTINGNYPTAVSDSQPTTTSVATIPPAASATTQPIPPARTESVASDTTKLVVSHSTTEVILPLKSATEVLPAKQSSSDVIITTTPGFTDLTTKVDTSSQTIPIEVPKSTSVGISSVIVTQTTAPITAAAFTIASSTVTANSDTQFYIGSLTLTPGGTVIVTGSEGPKTFILPSTASIVVINGVTQSIQTMEITQTPPIPYIVYQSSTYTPNSVSNFVIGGQTLSQGAAITLPSTITSGDITITTVETLSLPTGGSSVVIVNGMSTATYSMGNLIASTGVSLTTSAIGASSSLSRTVSSPIQTSTLSPSPLTGGASASCRGTWTMIWVVFLGYVVV